MKKIFATAILSVALLLMVSIMTSAGENFSAVADGAKKVSDKASDTAKDTTKKAATKAKAESGKVGEKAVEKAKSAAQNDTITTETGLKYIVTKKGSGAVAKVGQLAQVNYAGRFTDGKEFDNSSKRGGPLEFPLGAGRVIKGWDEGIAGMLVGEKRTFFIPAKLGWGSRGSAPVIPPDADLIFDVELVGVRDMASGR